MVFYPLECLKKRVTGLCYSSMYGSLTTALAVNSLLVFINPMQLPGSRGDAVYLCVGPHLPVRNREETGKSTASWSFPCVKYFPVINSNKWIYAILKWLSLCDQGRTGSGNLGPGFQNCSGLKCLNLIRAGLSKAFEVLKHRSDLQLVDTEQFLILILGFLENPPSYNSNLWNIITTFCSLVPILFESTLNFRHG